MTRCKVSAGPPVALVSPDLSRPGRGPNPLPAEADPPAEPFDPIYDEAPSDEYLDGAVAMLRGLLLEGKVR